MHRPCTNHMKPSSEDVVRASNRTQEATQLRSTTHKDIEEKVEGMPQCPHSNEVMDIEPRLLLQTLLDWEDDYVPPPHVCHQKAENCFNPEAAVEEEVVAQTGRSNSSVLWENPTRFDIMRELGNILKVEISPPFIPIWHSKVELSIL